MIDFGLAADDIASIQHVFAANPKVSQVILFGSRAMDTYKPGSDIDLAVAGNGITLDIMLELSEELERLGLLYSFDLQNIKEINDPDVIEHISRVGKIFYNKTL